MLLSKLLFVKTKDWLLKNNFYPNKILTKP